MKKKLLLVALLISGASFGQVLTEDFEGLGGALPAGWSSASTAPGSGDFITGDAAAANAAGFWAVPGPSNFAMVNDDVCNCDLSAAYLTTPSMNFTGLSGVVLTYDFVDDITYGPSLPHQVELSIDGGATWSSIYTYTVDNGNLNWQNNFLALGAATDGAADVMIRWFYNDGGTWATGLAIDNVVISEPLPNNVSLAGITLPRYAAINSNLPLDMNVMNLGSNPVTSITADWNDGTAHSQMINVNIAPGASANVTHPDLVTYAMAVERGIDVTITQVNGGADSDPSDNASATMLHNTVSQVVQKNVVIEEGTGTWCGWCPRGAVAMDYMAATYPSQFIGIAVHNGDPMTVSAYDSGANFGGYPSSNTDRAILDATVSQAAFESYYNSRKDMVVPAGLSIVNSGSGNSVVLDVTATFYTPFAASNYRLAVVLAEDHVTGTSSSYDQVNFYSGGGQGAMGGFESLPDPVPAADMVYDHVGRALLGGYDGQAGSVPAVITDGGTAQYTFNYTLPASGQDRGNMYAVAMLIDQSNGEIVNAEKISIATLGLAETSVINMNVYPNPANDNLNVAFEIEGDVVITLTDMQGRVVLTSDYSNLSGAQNISIPVASLVSGNYILSIATEGVSYNESVIIK